MNVNRLLIKNLSVMGGVRALAEQGMHDALKAFKFTFFHKLCGQRCTPWSPGSLRDCVRFQLYLLSSPPMKQDPGRK